MYAFMVRFLCFACGGALFAAYTCCSAPCRVLLPYCVLAAPLTAFPHCARAAPYDNFFLSSGVLYLYVAIGISLPFASLGGHQAV